MGYFVPVSGAWQQEKGNLWHFKDAGTLVLTLYFDDRTAGFEVGEWMCDRMLVLDGRFTRAELCEYLAQRRVRPPNLLIQ